MVCHPIVNVFVTFLLSFASIPNFSVFHSFCCLCIDVHNWVLTLSKKYLGHIRHLTLCVFQQRKFCQTIGLLFRYQTRHNVDICDRVYQTIPMPEQSEIQFPICDIIFMFIFNFMFIFMFMFITCSCLSCPC